MINTVRYTLLREQILEIAVGLGCLTSQQQAEILRIQAKLKADHDAASAPHSRLSPLTLQAQIAALPQILEAVKDPQFADNNPEAEILYLKLKYGPFPMSFMRPTAALQNWVVKLCIGCVSLHYSTVLDIEPPAHSIKRWIFRFYHFEL